MSWLKTVVNAVANIWTKDETPVVSYRIVEVEKPHKTINWNTDVLGSIATLSSHPGFQALIAYLSTQRAAIETKLVREQHPDIRTVEFLQAGVFWTNWLQDQVNRSVNKLTIQEITPSVEEDAVFREIDSMLERVGR